MYGRIAAAKIWKKGYISSIYVGKMYREALSHCMSGVVSRWNHTYKNGFMNTRFLSWPYFVSSVGWNSFPQLAVFHFLSWLHFTSSVGRYSFPQLAVFHFLSWPCFVSSVGRKLPKEDYCCMEELLQATQDWHSSGSCSLLWKLPSHNHWKV